MEIFAATLTVLFRFRQIVHDPFPDQILGQRLPPGPLLNGRFGRLLISARPGGGWLFAGLFRLPGMPEFFKQLQLLFRELFALAAALRFQQFGSRLRYLSFSALSCWSCSHRSTTIFCNTSTSFGSVWGSMGST
jgi:hypothetical protein